MMQETVSNVLAAIMIVLLCMMVLSLFILAVSVLLDSIRNWQERKPIKCKKPKKNRKEGL